MIKNVDEYMLEIGKAEQECAHIKAKAEQDVQKYLSEANAKVEKIQEEINIILKQKVEELNFDYHQKLEKIKTDGETDGQAGVNKVRLDAQDKIPNIAKTIMEEILSECQ